MMDSNDYGVLLSIHPEWVEKIFSGRKTYEVRKNKPKMEPPFTVYVYCTLSGKELLRGGIHGNDKLNGKICAEFTCDRVDKIVVRRGMGMVLRRGDEYIRFGKDNGMCLTKPELYEYIGSGHGYAWHISDLVVYDKPLALADFTFAGCVTHLRYAPQGIVYVNKINR